jgi:7-carboxy-7-deazaguanine synthase
MSEINVNEIFCSLQGEGSRAGSLNIFIRLQGCKAKNACYAAGVRCDTEFESGRTWLLPQLFEFLEQFDCRNIIWTGGEPAQQLTDDIVAQFKAAGYFQAIETSGLFATPEGLDYITVSPKVAEHVVAKNFTHVNELRYVRNESQGIPSPAVTADHYFLSPHFDGGQINDAAVRHCINLIKENPTWKLSLQLHKLLNIP